MAESVTAAVRVCVPPRVIESWPTPPLLAFVAVNVIEVTGQVTNGTAGLLIPAVEAIMLACPGPTGVTVPAGNVAVVLVGVPELLMVVPGVLIVAIVASLLDHWKGSEWSTAPPVAAVAAVRSAVMSQGAVVLNRDWQTAESLLYAVAWNCGNCDVLDTKDSDVQFAGELVISTLSTGSCT